MPDTRYLRTKAHDYLTLAERAGGGEAAALRALATECISDAQKLEDAKTILKTPQPTAGDTPTRLLDLASEKSGRPPHRHVCLNCNRDMRPIFRDEASGTSEPEGFECQPCGLTCIGRTT